MKEESNCLRNAAEVCVCVYVYDMAYSTVAFFFRIYRNKKEHIVHPSQLRSTKRNEAIVWFAYFFAAAVKFSSSFSISISTNTIYSTYSTTLWQVHGTSEIIHKYSPVNCLTLLCHQQQQLNKKLVKSNRINTNNSIKYKILQQQEVTK